MSHDAIENLSHEDRSFPPSAEFAAQANAQPSLYDVPFEELWEREVKEIFHAIPLPVCTSAELANVGDYKAMRVVGREIILVRGKDGHMNAMLNVCRHRAMKLLPGGCGNSRRFTCSYHAWTYDTDGRLTGVPGEDTFGDVDKADYSLVRLACDERAGIIFVGLGIVLGGSGTGEQIAAGYDADQSAIFDNGEVTEAACGHHLHRFVDKACLAARDHVARHEARCGHFKRGDPALCDGANDVPL